MTHRKLICLFFVFVISECSFHYHQKRHINHEVAKAYQQITSIKRQIGLMKALLLKDPTQYIKEIQMVKLSSFASLLAISQRWLDSIKDTAESSTGLTAAEKESILKTINDDKATAQLTKDLMIMMKKQLGGNDNNINFTKTITPANISQPNKTPINPISSVLGDNSLLSSLFGNFPTTSAQNAIKHQNATPSKSQLQQVGSSSPLNNQNKIPKITQPQQLKKSLLRSD